MLRAAAPAKLNLALVVGPLRDDGRHELVTIVEKLALSDTVTVVRAPALQVEGFAGDTLVRDALVALAERAGADASFAATIQKHIPVTAGLGGGSSDAAAALRLANGLLGEPLADPDLHALAAGLGADLPLFLVAGGVLATGDGTSVAPLTLPRDYHVVLSDSARRDEGIDRVGVPAVRRARGSRVSTRDGWRCSMRSPR